MTICEHENHHLARGNTVFSPDSLHRKAAGIPSLRAVGNSWKGLSGAWGSDGCWIERPVGIDDE